MAKPLVVVESPAKAKTISKFLGNAYDVRASVGHVADLPSKGLAVDVDNGFKPTYELTERGKQVVKDLRAALKDASELYLATDEDREGEAISWHLLEHLKPKVPVKRMVFHEITAAAIDHAVNNPRGIDYGLVDAAETRRILDRLYGYEVSPVLWRRVNRGLSAGRVQSPSIRLIVERERERIAFVSAGYWDIELTTATAPSFTADLVAVDGTRVATGKDFDAGGQAGANVVVLDEARARGLATGLEGADFRVRSVEEKPYRSRPQAPFRTSTLQQEGGRKLRLSSSQVMRVAQGLYERGYITYMRTDSVTLSDEALQAVRAAVAVRVRPAVPVAAAQAVRLEGQERPGGPRGDPPDDAAALAAAAGVGAQRPGPLAVPPDLAAHAGVADGRRHRHDRHGAPRRRGRPTARDAEFSASGTTITFPGYRAVYVESRDEDDRRRRRARGADAAARRRRRGRRRRRSSRRATRRRRPPATPRRRSSSASRSSRSAGPRRGRRSSRPSRTVATCGRRARRSCRRGPRSPSSACSSSTSRTSSTTTSRPRSTTTSTSSPTATRQKEQWLQSFYFGDDTLPGLKRLVEENLDEIDAAAINTFPIGLDADGQEVVVKPGKYGPYVKRGDDTASVPEDLTPDELTLDKALELLAAPKSDEPIGELDGPAGVRQERPLRPVRAVGHAPTTRRPGSTSRRCRACSRRWSSSGSRWTRPRRC